MDNPFPIFLLQTMNYYGERDMNLKILSAAAAMVYASLCLCSCTAYDKSASPDPNAPVIEFTAQTESDDGLPEYYLFDDNPEHLNSKFLADGETPSSIAHFDELTPGIYTVFSYHHRGYSTESDADLYYDAVFSSETGGSFEIMNLGLDHNWNWNQAWADYSGVTVEMPEFLRTFNCTCGDKCGCSSENGKCIQPECPAIIRGEKREPKTRDFIGLNITRKVQSGEQLYLSELIPYIKNADINHFRYGGWNEPMWLMMKFKVTDGTVNFDTAAYSDINAAKASFGSWLKGPFDNEPQYKCIVKNAPIVTTEFDYEITDLTKSGAIPVTVKNMRVPDGYTIENGTFATNVNTWRERQPIAAESDLMLIEYKDGTKLPLYGKNAENKDNIWHFDAYHTKVYSISDRKYNRKLRSFGIQTDDTFVPNGNMHDTDYPKGAEVSTDEFYKYTACNLGNFGVTEKYKIHVSNTGTKQRAFWFDIKSIAGQVYRYTQTDSSGRIISSDDGRYIMKKFDDDPKENPASSAEPKERLAAAEYSDTLSFDIAPKENCDIEIEITTLTGCVAPMHNTFGIE